MPVTPREVTPNSNSYPPNLKHAVFDSQAFQDSPFLKNKVAPDMTPPTLSMVGQPNEKPAVYLSVIGSRPPTEEDAQELKVPLKQLLIEYSQRLETLFAFLPHLFQAFAQDFPHQTLSLVSGLTIGGDEEAMKLAFEHEIPVVGVLASPLDRIHPQGSHAIYNELLIRIMEGAPGYRLVSRHPWPKGKELKPFDSLTRDYRPDYIPRDRVTAGLSHATLAWNIRQLMSGTTYTMAVSHGLGRPVFGVRSTISPQVIEVMEQHPDKVTLVSDPQPVLSALKTI